MGSLLLFPNVCRHRTHGRPNLREVWQNDDPPACLLFLHFKDAGHGMQVQTTSVRPEARIKAVTATHISTLFEGSLRSCGCFVVDFTMLISGSVDDVRQLMRQIVLGT